MLLLVPNLIWEAGHDWVSVHWFLHPPPSGSDETRPQYIFNTLLLPQLIAVPIAVAGIVFLIRERTLRPFGWTIVGTVVAFFLLGGKSYYALPALLVALAAGAIGFDRWASRRRLIGVGVAYVALDLALLPLAIPVLPLKTAERSAYRRCPRRLPRRDRLARIRPPDTRPRSRRKRDHHSELRRSWRTRDPRQRPTALTGRIR